MLMRGAAMALGAPILGLGAAFVAGATAGFGLGVATVGAACLARRAMRHRRDWHDPIPAEAGPVGPQPGDDEPHPGLNPA